MGGRWAGIEMKKMAVRGKKNTHAKNPNNNQLLTKGAMITVCGVNTTATGTTGSSESLL